MDINLDWKSIAGTVAPLAPKLGAVLGTGFGGPLGGVIGGLAGTALASVFGVEPTPEAVGKAIADDPDASAKIQQLEADRGEEIRAQAQVQIEALKQATERQRIAADDTDRARQFGIALANTHSPLSWGTTILSSVFTIAFFVLLAIYVANSDSIKENPTLTLLMGVLVGSMNQIVNYFFGSSQGSKNNADRYADLATAVVNKPNPSPAVVEAVKAAAGKKK